MRTFRQSFTEEQQIDILSKHGINYIYRLQSDNAKEESEVNAFFKPHIPEELMERFKQQTEPAEVFLFDQLYPETDKTVGEA